VIITASMGRFFRIASKPVWEPLARDRWLSYSLPHKIQAVAQGPSGSIFTLADKDGILYQLDIQRRSCEKLCASLDYTRSWHLDKMMAISMPQDDVTHVFWIERGKMMFAAVMGWKEVRREIIPNIDY
jgi:hypothetical protein